MTTQQNLAADLKKRFGGIADRITLYTPFVPGETDAWWRNLVKKF
jgi:hypothetical protein